MLITWDEPKRKANLEKHGLDFADLTDAFFLESTIKMAKLAGFRPLGGLPMEHSR